MDRQPKIGDRVLFVDEHGVERDALLTMVFDGGASHPDYPLQNPTVNLVFVSGDESRHDNYGRQTERHSSVVHASRTTVRGMCWDWPAAA